MHTSSFIFLCLSQQLNIILLTFRNKLIVTHKLSEVASAGVIIINNLYIVHIFKNNKSGVAFKNTTCILFIVHPPNAVVLDFNVLAHFFLA